MKRQIHGQPELKEVGDNSRYRVSGYQREIQLKEGEISSLKQTLGDKDTNLCAATRAHDHIRTQAEELVKITDSKDRTIAGLKNEIDGLKNELDALYTKRRVEGTALLEVEHLKADNERLVGILKGTHEYKEFAEFIEDSGGALKLSTRPATAKRGFKAKAQTDVKADWVPQDVFLFKTNVRHTS